MKTIVGALGHAEIDLPAGWYRVLSGAIKPGDYELDVGQYVERSEVVWLPLTRFPRARDPYGTADWYFCLIRFGEPVDALCPRCHTEPVRIGYRYCEDCCWKVLHELRRRFPPSAEWPAESRLVVLEIPRNHPAHRR